MIRFDGKPHSIAVTGGYLDLVNPDPDAIRLTDIASALSRVIRFGGHGINPPSVAAHSVLCWRLAVMHGLPRHLCRVALMHDAAEAYVGDIPTPLKTLLGDFARIEARVHLAICNRFGLQSTIPAEVKEIDAMALAVERRGVFPMHDPWPGLPALPVGSAGALPLNSAAEALFLSVAKHEGLS